MPCYNDPPENWAFLADRMDVDPNRPAMGECPVVAGVYLDWVASEVVMAMRAPADWRGDWQTLCGWLREGLDPYEHILPAIKRVMERRGPGADPIGRLGYFDAAVREQRQVRKVG
ncbi:MAG TPA: hypothetical protein VHY82_15940 [Acetobacteraceae bacterium]|jgi:hypothetical protein|nr:hypothetical protein [Acetobacteraceae bacterium]